MDSTELIEHREDLAFAREQDKTDKNIRAASLAMGALPTVGLMATLLKATQGYKTGLGQHIQQSVTPPPLIPPFIQNLIDAGIKDVEGLVNWIIANAPGFLPNTVKTVTADIYQALPPFLQQLLDAGVTDANGVLHYLGLPALPGTSSSPPALTPTAGYLIETGPYLSQAAADAAAAVPNPNWPGASSANRRVLQYEDKWYVETTAPAPAGRAPGRGGRNG